MKKKGEQPTPEQAKALLWEAGELTWLLTDVQKEMKKNIETDSTRTSVVVASRRLGKTWMLVTLALEQCLKKPNSIVKFLLPKQKDVKTVIKPLLREITETCPSHLIPIYNTQDKIYTFPHNGSEIHLAGADIGAEGLRGTRADLVILDETGFINDLLYSIRSILSPTIRTTRGRMVMASTPSRDPQHEFIQHYMNPYKASGRLQIYDIYKNPNFTQEIIDEIIEDYPLGINDPDFRREYMCEVFVDEEAAVCPEFSHKKDVIVFNDETAPEMPDFVDFYVGADIGFKDLTVMLFGYYDFKKGALVILDELVMNGPSMTTDALAKEISNKEKVNFFNNNHEQKAYLRVMDVDLKLRNDLQLLHGIGFSVTKKDNREGAINEMRMWVNQERILIHERCKHLVYHLEFGQWKANRSDFAKLPDTPDKTIRGGHVDAIPALYYLIRNIHTYRNPYPNTHGILTGSNVHMSVQRQEEKSEATEFMENILNLRKKKRRS